MTSTMTRPPAVAEPAGDAAPAISGVTPMERGEIKLQRRMVAAMTIIPFVGVLVAVASLWGRGLSLVDAAIALSLYVFSGLGITIGFHRLFTHQSFEATLPLKVALAVAGSMAVEGSVIGWAAAHRRHHAFADKEGDPHSPHLDEGPGAMGVLRGLWHAHVGWLAAPEKTDPERWAPDLLKDPYLRGIDRLFPVLAVVSFALPAALGGLVTGTLGGAVTAFLWGSLVRVFLLHHVTWSINSICHFYGKRPFASRDFSTNNWVLAIVSFGESWHNNHHAFPTSARHGIGRGQIDISARLISLLEKARLAGKVRGVTPKQLARKAVGDFRATKRVPGLE